MTPVRPRHADMLADAAVALPAPDAPWRRVELPHAIDEAAAWYRIEFDAPADRSDSWAVYLPYFYGGGRLFLNGLPLAHVADSTAGYLVRWERPHLLSIPDALLRPGRNVLLVRPSAEHLTRRVRQSLLAIGPHAQLIGEYERRLFWVRTMPQFTVVGALVVGLFVLLIWWRRRDELLYGLFGIVALMWGVRTLTFVIEVLPADWWSPWRLLYYTATGGFIIALTVFSLRLAGWGRPALERSLFGWWLVGPLAYIASGGSETLVGRLWIGSMIPIGLSMVLTGAVAAWRERTPTMIALASALALGVAAAVHDYLLSGSAPLLQKFAPQWTAHRIFLLHYGADLVLLVMSAILSARFVETLQALEQLNVELEQRVADKGADLLHALNGMRVAKDGAEAANRAKSTFLAAASHDLRQPAHALGLYIAALRGERLSVVQGEVVERMSTSIGALDTMFNALLDVSRMDAGAVVVDMQPFELEPILLRLAEEFSNEAAAKGLRLSVRVGAAARRLRARSDPFLVERIVRNLVGNAVKYTRQGGVLLTCRLSGGPSPRWRIEVWDTGTGISAADRERVFEEFFQIGDSERDRAGGLGLGLSIVRRLAQLLDHPVRMHSVVGTGSRFVLELPVTADAPRAETSAVSTGSLQRLGVGVVDDDPEVREGMRVLLESWGCDVTVGASADELLERAGDHPADRLQVLVVDYELRSGGQGVDAIDALRRACATRQPALIVSGASAPERLAELQASGFEWLIKPVAPARRKRPANPS